MTEPETRRDELWCIGLIVGAARFPASRSKTATSAGTSEAPPPPLRTHP